MAVDSARAVQQSSTGRSLYRRLERSVSFGF
jgi:hypothetical protein